MQTSDLRGAGTDANVYLSLYGTLRGQPVKLPAGEGGFALDDSHDNFERNKLDTFLLKRQPRLDSLERVVIGHDSRGAFAAWHLAWLEVEAAAGAEVYFPGGLWLQRGKGGSKAEVRPAFQSLLAASDIPAERD